MFSLEVATEDDADNLKETAGNLVGDRGAFLSQDFRSEKLDLFYYLIFIAHPTLEEDFTLLLHRMCMEAYMKTHNMTKEYELLEFSKQPFKEQSADASKNVGATPPSPTDN